MRVTQSHGMLFDSNLSRQIYAMYVTYLIPMHSSTGKVAQLRCGKHNVGPFLSWAYTGAFLFDDTGGVIAPPT